MVIREIKDLYDNVVKFTDNLTKEPIERRENQSRVNKQLIEVGKLESHLNNLKKQSSNVTDSEISRKLKDYFKAIDSYLAKSRDILTNRLEFIVSQEKQSVGINTVENKSQIMGEKFDLKTAASLLPHMDGTEDSTRQLIDAVELYSELLDNDGKTFLIKYVLKAKLSQSAKMRLEQTYANINDLIQDMKSHLLSKKSAASLSTQLHSAKQGNKSIEEYAGVVEQLLLDLTIAESENNANAATILREVNEKLALNAFSNGLKNSDLRTIIKSRNYNKLKDAVLAAKEEELVQTSGSSQGSNIFHMRGRYNRPHAENVSFVSRSSVARGNRGRNFTQNRGRGNYFNNYSRQHNRHNANNGYGQGRGRASSRYLPRSRNFAHRAYFADQTNTTEQTNDNKQFFRVN
jgi:hypothetical protein